MIDAGKVFVLIFALLLFIAGIAMMGWMFSYQAVLYNGDAFNFANPMGLLAIVIIILVSGFYFFRISVELIMGHMRG